jgi:ABC-type Mn2+/Zn2+ transport system ATPase subunit
VSDVLCAAQELEVSVAGRRLHAPISFRLHRGDILQISGGNGAGKTTLIRTLLGQHNDYHGSLRRPIGGFSYVPQGASAFMTLDLHALYALLPEPSPATRAIEGLLSLKEISDSPLGVLSGGQRQRALLSVALRKPHDVLLLELLAVAIDKGRSERAVILVEHRMRHRMPASAQMDLLPAPRRSTPVMALMQYDV